MQIAVLVDDLSCSLGILIVTLHHVEALAAHLALHANGTFLACFWVEHLYVYKRIVAAYGRATLFEGVVQTGLRHTRRRLGKSIYAGNGHIHLFADLLHQLDRTERTCHDTCAQTGEVEHREHGVVQLGYEHGGYAIDGRTPFFMYRGEYHEGVELLDHYLRTAVCQTVHRGQYHAEAMEQGHTDAKLVVLRKSHVFAREVAVVGNTEVGQHHALGESRGATGVLHVAYIVAADLFLHLVQRIVLDVLS